MKPDLGLRLIAQGLAPSVELHWYDLALDHLSRSAPDLLTTIVETTQGGAGPFAASFDVPAASFHQLVKALPRDYRAPVADWIDRAPLGDTFELPVPAVLAHVGARLGSPVVGASGERFVPLVVCSF